MVAQPSSDAAALKPRHVAIIMDGNGRWARKRMLPRTLGHREGVEALRRTVDAAAAQGLDYLTVFAFSTENWRRPVAEVNALVELLRLYVDRDLKRLADDGVRVRIIGDRADLAADILEMIDRAERRTAANTRLNLTIAFNYGGRQEIARAARRIAEDVAAGKLAPQDVTPESFDAYLDTSGLPAPDLIIRTSGELRLSNFLLWQAAYSELVFLDVLWPDFDKDALAQAIDAFAARGRRFGGLEAP